jgi:hypothetical protein
MACRAIAKKKLTPRILPFVRYDALIQQVRITLFAFTVVTILTRTATVSSRNAPEISLKADPTSTKIFQTQEEAIAFLETNQAPKEWKLPSKG